MKFNVKKLRPDAILPQRAHQTDSGWDLHIVEFEHKEHDLWFGHTGLAIEPPDGYYVELVMRSSFPKSGLRLANAIGIIDHDYRGEIVALIEKRAGNVYLPPTPLKAVQMIFKKMPDIDGFELVEKLGITERGIGGFGSTTKESQ